MSIWKLFTNIVSCVKRKHFCWAYSDTTKRQSGILTYTTPYREGSGHTSAPCLVSSEQWKHHTDYLRPALQQHLHTGTIRESMCLHKAETTVQLRKSFLRNLICPHLTAGWQAQRGGCVWMETARSAICSLCKWLACALHWFGREPRGRYAVSRHLFPFLIHMGPWRI